MNQDPNPKFYVSTTGTTGAGCGPRANPCSSISEAQTNAVANGIQNIRVAGGTYTGPLNLVSSMNITGGWAQELSDFGPDQVAGIFGTGTAPAVTINAVTNSSIAGVSAQGVTPHLGRHDGHPRQWRFQQRGDRQQRRPANRRRRW